MKKRSLVAYRVSSPSKGVGESSFVRYVFEAIRRLSCSYCSPITSWCAEDCGGLDWRLIASREFFFSRLRFSLCTLQANLVGLN